MHENSLSSLLFLSSKHGRKPIFPLISSLSLSDLLGLVVGLQQNRTEKRRSLLTLSRRSSVKKKKFSFLLSLSAQLEKEGIKEKENRTISLSRPILVLDGYFYKISPHFRYFGNFYFMYDFISFHYYKL
jgi:hypothetical protein